MSVLEKKLPPKAEQVIAALLTERTQEEAAVKAGVGVSTLRRWLTEEGFLSLYRETRRQALDHAVGRLLEVTTLAVDVLKNNLSSDKEAIQVRSAVSILDLAFKGAEIAELSTRLDALEKAFSNRKGGGG
jgi:hypothetical protein